MAYTQGLCSAIQVNLNEIAGSNAPALRREKVGYVDAIMSDANRAGFTAQIVPTNGKFRTVQINYQTQLCDDRVSTSCDVNCTPDVIPAPSEQLITSFSCLKYKMSFDENEMRKLCEPDSVWVGQTIMNAMNGVNVALDKALLATVYGPEGTQYLADNGTCTAGTLEVPMFLTGGQPNPMAWAYIKHIYEQTGANGVPFLIGSSSIDLFAKATQMACCNTNFGMDLSNWMGDAYYYTDRFISGVIDPDMGILLAPGTRQLVLWNKYVGDYAKRNDSFEHGTIVDPFTGLVYDLKTNYDDCAEKWYAEISLNYNHWALPTGGCACPDYSGFTLIHNCASSSALAC
mgnify:CR=1 FL=1